MQHEIGKWVSMIYRRSNVFMQNELAPTGLTAAVFPYLLAVADKPGIGQDQLARDFSIDKGTVARAIGKLVKLGLARKQTDSADKRRHSIFATQKGKNYLSLVYQSIDKLNTILLAGFDPEQTKCTMENLSRIAANSAACLDEA